ncbi:MAG: D-glycerate dehydrogenase [Actinomycetota bacterium]|nr:D-glycerate dehydrogenase [Actinomycetota bacterium]
MTCPLPEAATGRLRGAGCEIVTLPDGVPLGDAARHGALVGVDALVCTLTDRVDAAVLDAAPDLAVVATVSVGHEHIDTAHAARREVVVRTTPGALDAATADLTMLLILAACRRSSDAEATVRGATWTGWRLDQHLGLDLDGGRLGIVGWGRIGRAVAARAAAFGLEVIHHARRPTGDASFVADLDELLARSDVVSLHVPLTPDTRHLIDGRRLGLLRPTAVLVNTSRGAVVDEAALAEALHAGRLFGAGLDVYESEPDVHPRLRSAPGVTLLPHIGSATVRTRARMADLAVDGVLDALAAHPTSADRDRPTRRRIPYRSTATAHEETQRP